MKKLITSILASLLAISPCYCALADVSQAAFLPHSLSGIVEKSSPAVVCIMVPKKTAIKNFELDIEDSQTTLEEILDFFKKDNAGGAQNASKENLALLGSGFVIDPTGYIVTNSHVIDETNKIFVTLSSDDNKYYQAKLIGKDQEYDLALLKIEAETALPFLNFANSEEAKVGDFVLAIGNPFGFKRSVSFGIISAKPEGHYHDYLIQTDAAINLGSSGGPLLNMNGEVVGINSAFFFYMTKSKAVENSQIGFAVPSSIASQVIEQIKTKGFVSKGYIGVNIQAVDKALASGFGLQDINGALVNKVIKGSPAEKAGMQIGDVIIKLNSIQIDSHLSLPKIVRSIPVGEKVTLEVMRDQKKIVLETTVAQRRNPQEDINDTASQAVTVFGMTIRELNSSLIQEFGLENSARGAIVADVDRYSLAALSGVKPGDLITHVNKKEINNLKEFSESIKHISQSGNGAATFLVQRGEYSLFISMEKIHERS